MKREIEMWTADRLYRNRNQIQFPDFQREPTVWTEEKRRLLIDSMLKGLDIPKIYLYKSEKSGYDCVDGRQRIESIIEFFDGYLRLPKPDGRTWGRLSIKEKKTLDDYEFTIAIITQATDEELRLLFERLQLGAPLIVGEKLHAMTGDMRNFVFETGKNHPFIVSVRIPRRRFAKETVFAQICLNSFYRSFNQDFITARYDELKEFFKQYRDLKPYKLQINKIKNTLDKLNEYFGEDADKLRNRAVIVSVYLFFEELIENGDSSKLERFSEFYKQFIDVLNDQVSKGLEYDRQYREILDFQANIIQAAVGKSAIEARNDMLKDYFQYYLKTGRIKKTLS